MVRASHLVFAAVLCALGLSSTTQALPSTSIVISQIYGGGGNSGATYTHDFIELYNRGTEPVTLTGWSVQYAAATSTSNFAVTALTGILPAGEHYLIQLDDGSGGSTPLPTANAIGTTNLNATTGKVAVRDSITALTGTNVHFAAGVFDFVGYGTSANDSETTPTGNGSNTTALLRAAAGATDTDNNSADFTAGDPNPRNYVPEPTSLTLLAAGAFCLATRRPGGRNARR